MRCVVGWSGLVALLALIIIEYPCTEEAGGGQELKVLKAID